jgi:hypothetical protein
MATLTPGEKKLVGTLPRPRAQAPLHLGSVAIVEWLNPDEPHTGRRLHDYLEAIRPGWSTYQSCQSAREVLEAIRAVTEQARTTGTNPVLHIEAHGAEDGLQGPYSTGGREGLSWPQLMEPLQALNIVTCCNLIVFFAACTGIAGLQAMAYGDRAPALAAIGPADVIGSNQLLLASKEFYRELKAGKRTLEGIVECASEAGGQDFFVEPLMEMVYDVMVEHMVLSLRPDVWERQLDRVRLKMREVTQFDDVEIDRRLRELPRLRSAEYQLAWDQMFMIDLYSENRIRFSLDMRAVVNALLAGA